MKKTSKDGHWTVYKLPHANNYVGMTGDFVGRMRVHKWQGNNPLDPVILGVFDTEEEAKEVERMFHVDFGYPGKRSISLVGREKISATLKNLYQTEEGKAILAKIDQAARAKKTAANTDQVARAKKTAANTDYAKRALKYYKPVLQEYEDGSFIKEWSSQTEVKQVTGITISLCLSGKNKTAGKDSQGNKFVWRYKNDNNN
jgi:hypothetical protein